MLEKFVQNLIPGRHHKQITHNYSLNNRSRDYRKQQMPDLMIRKAKSSQWETPLLLVSMWETESTVEMFDYENKNVKLRQHKLDTDHDIYISNMEKRHAKCILTKPMALNDNTYCGSITRSKGQFYFVPVLNVESYRIIGNKLSDRGNIRVGNMIRIGRMKYFIRELFDGIETKFQQFSRNEKAKQVDISSLSSGTCKFCLCDQKDNPDILISPCNCKGSCAQVHLQCLKQWLSNKVSRKSTPCVEFLNYDNFSCQICKQDLPISMKIDGKCYNMLSEGNSIKEPYITLQGIPNEKSSIKNNMTVRINFRQKNSLIIGRGHESDIKLEDVSISRQHCFIRFEKGRFYLIDNNSKFGTLIKVQANQKINLSENRIQIARMTIQLAKPGYPSSQPSQNQLRH